MKKMYFQWRTFGAKTKESFVNYKTRIKQKINELSPSQSRMVAIFMLAFIVLLGIFNAYHNFSKTNTLTPITKKIESVTSVVMNEVVGEDSVYIKNNEKQ